MIFFLWSWRFRNICQSMQNQNIYQFVCQIFPTSADENLHLQKSWKISASHESRKTFSRNVFRTPLVSWMEDAKMQMDKLLILLAY